MEEKPERSEKPEKPVTRRAALQIGFGLAAGATAGALFARTPGTAADGDCATPEQAEGPFFPKRERLDTDADLTRIEGHDRAAEGDVVYVEGAVVDDAMRPVEGAIVHVWQANAHGRYDHEDDPNPAPLDPHFQGWARLKTDAGGRFGFRTIRPGAYPADASWMRPPHIHFKVSKRAHRELITQTYFAGDPLNEADLLLGELAPAERERLVLDFAPSDAHGGVPTGYVTFVIDRIPAA